MSKTIIPHEVPNESRSCDRDGEPTKGEEFLLRHWYGPKGKSADDYCLLSVKQSPDRRSIAIRTSSNDGDGPEWLVIDTDGNMRPCSHLVVIGWIDLKPPPQGWQ